MLHSITQRSVAEKKRYGLENFFYQLKYESYQNTQGFSGFRYSLSPIFVENAATAVQVPIQVFFYNVIFIKKKKLKTLA